MSDLIKPDVTFWECTAIDTEEWLKAVLDEQIAGDGIDNESFDDRNLSQGWLMERSDDIKEWIQDENDGREFEMTEVDNIYNYENDFSSVFQYQIFYPADEHSCGEWYYCDDVYVAIEVHIGGDVRGNYGGIRLYKASQLCEAGFLDWVIGWSVVDHKTDERIEGSDRFERGYSSNPTCELREYVKACPGSSDESLYWSEKRNCFVGWITSPDDGSTRVRLAYPECHVGV